MSKLLIFAIFFVCVYLVFLIASVADIFYCAKSSNSLFGGLHGKNVRIVGGQHEDREGKVVSYSILDLRVTVNCMANDEEKEKLWRKSVDDDVGWVRQVNADKNNHSGEIVENVHDNPRVWLPVWRWQVKVQ